MRKIDSWDNYFLDMAHLVSSKSKDLSTKVGCVIARDNIVLTSGYNGLPRRVKDVLERMNRPAKYLWTSHAEENAIAQAARVGARLEDGTAYVTHRPCCRCARSMIQAGVARIVCDDLPTSMPEEEFEVAGRMFEEAGIEMVVRRRLASGALYKCRPIEDLGRDELLEAAKKAVETMEKFNQK